LLKIEVEGLFRVDMVGPVVRAFVAVAFHVKTYQNKLPADKARTSLKKTVTNLELIGSKGKKRHKSRKSR